MHIKSLDDGLWSYRETHFNGSINEGGEFLKIFKAYGKDHMELKVYNILGSNAC